MTNPPASNEDPLMTSDEIDQAFASVSAELKTNQTSKKERPALFFIVFMLALAGFMATLGFWQLARLSQKLEIITRIETRMQAPAQNLPPVAEWTAFDADVWDFRPVNLTGTFVPEQTVLVFANLVNPRGRTAGPGYWVITPFQDMSGGTVLVNQGFVPQDKGKLYKTGQFTPSGEVTLSGIARESERANAFTPGPDYTNGIDWITNVDRLKVFLHPTPQQLAPVYVDLDVANPDSLPQAGETKLELPNKHLEYALTWFSLAAITPILLGFWIFRRRQG